MPKRKKYPRLPNGMGEIRYLGKNRRNPYAVHPPSSERDETGRYIRKPALCYVPDWYTGFGVLSAYRSGTYTPGLELTIAQEVVDATVNLDAFCRRVLRSGNFKASTAPTLEAVWELFKAWKFGENAPKKLSDNALNAYRQGYKYLLPIKDRPIDTISIDEIQTIVNECQKKKATKENIVLAAKGIYKFAESRKFCDNVARYLVLPDGDDDEHGVPLSDDELAVLAAHKDDKDIQMILIMCYSGFRASAYHDIEVNMDKWYFQGGIKTAAGKNRIVPIHSGIQKFLPMEFGTYQKMRSDFNQVMYKYGMSHTLHDCRHTFSMLCEKYGVREADRKRMMGHSFGADITNGIYGHRELEDLRKEIEKIKFVGSCGD